MVGAPGCDGFCANAEELTVFGEGAEERLGIGDAEFDFGLTRHGLILRRKEEMEIGK